MGDRFLPEDGSAGRQSAPSKETGRPGVCVAGGEGGPFLVDVSAAWRPASASSDPSLTRPSEGLQPPRSDRRGPRRLASLAARRARGHLRQPNGARLRPEGFAPSGSRILRPPFAEDAACCRQEMGRRKRHFSPSWRFLRRPAGRDVTPQRSSATVIAAGRREIQSFERLVIGPRCLRAGRLSAGQAGLGAHYTPRA